jgi:hypothetical protein
MARSSAVCLKQKCPARSGEILPVTSPERGIARRAPHGEHGALTTYDRRSCSIRNGRPAVRWQ